MCQFNLIPFNQRPVTQMMNLKPEFIRPDSNFLFCFTPNPSDRVYRRYRKV